ncbi:MAG: IclR family transcriptional regulator [Carnobacterium sp.]
MEKLKKPYGTVLIKASKILNFLSESDKGKTLKDISRNTEMTASTTLKILDTLLVIGYVTKDSETKAYLLGPALVKYANKYINDSFLIRIATPHLENLHKTIDETIHLGILNADEVMYLTKLEPQKQSIYMSSKVGSTRSMYSSAMGKSILAHFEEEELQSYLNRVPLIPYTEKTITSSVQLIEELSHVKHVGLAFDDEEMEKDCFCIGASIEIEKGKYGAFSVSVPKYRMTKKLQDSLINLIKETKIKIENDIKEC